MRVYRSLAEVGGDLAGCAVAIGNFDGVHLGHQRLLELARGAGAAAGGAAVALTFEPHPARVLRPALAPPLLTPLARKLELLAAAGVDATVVQPFDAEYARTEAATFVARDLAGALGAGTVVVGHDFTAGKGRAGVDALRPMLEASAIRLVVADPVARDGIVVSSTKIRELLLEGKVEGAALLLDRPHEVEDEVLRGAGRGRGFGFATANLRPAAMLPAHGVYAVRAWLARGVYAGVCNVGVKPTVQATGDVTAETHLFDFDGRDLYGERLRLAFVARLREERRFPSVDALRVQIARDAAEARALLGSGHLAR